MAESELGAVAGASPVKPPSPAAAVDDPNAVYALITDGQDSYRLAQATAGKGVKPLT